MENLNNLTAVRISQLLGKQGFFEIGHYNEPICTVIPVIRDCVDVVSLIYKLKETVNCDDYIIVRKPKTQGELAKVYRELERELNEGKVL